MIKVTKEQQPLLLELKQIEKEMRQAAEQARIYQTSLNILQRTIKKNQLTIKQLQKVAEDRAIYVPLGRAFLKRDKPSTIKQLYDASAKLQQNTSQMQKNQKFYTQKANDKHKILLEGMQRLKKMQSQ